MRVFVLLLGLLPALGFSQEFDYIGRPDLAVNLAAVDINELLESDPGAAAAAWYVWIRDSEDDELIDVYDWVLNYGTSRAEVPLRTTKIRGGAAGVLLRLDRREWFPTLSSQTNFVDIVEEYVDPHFYDYQALLQQPIKILETSQSGSHVRISCDPYVKDGKRYTSKWITPEEYEELNASHVAEFIDVRQFNPAVLSLARESADTLKEVTGLNVPIVEAERWLVHSLRTLDGGLYYRLQGYRDADGKGVNQQQWLDLFGVSEDDAAKADAEEFIGLWRSNVTAKARRAKFLQGRLVRPSVGSALTVITQDPADGDIETGQHPLYSLFDFKFAATEVLAMRPNGTVAYALFSDDGELQDAAPDDIVSDHTVPTPHTTRVESAISCIRCHGPDSQWRPMPNQVKTLLSTEFADNRRLRVFTDLSDPKRTQDEVLHGLAVRYSGDLTLPLRLARDAVEFTSARLVDFTLEADGYAVEAAARVARRFEKYVYTPITPQEALRTLGVRTTDVVAMEILKNLNPIGNSDVAVLADPAYVTLLLHEKDDSLVVTRQDWERIYASVLGTAIELGEIQNVEVDEPVAEVLEEIEDVEE